MCKEAKKCYKPVMLDSSKLGLISHVNKKVVLGHGKPGANKIFKVKIQCSGQMENIFMRPQSYEV